MAMKHSNATATERIDSEVMRFMVNIYCRKEDIKYKCTHNPSVGKKCFPMRPAYSPASESLCILASRKQMASSTQPSATVQMPVPKPWEKPG